MDVSVEAILTEMKKLNSQQLYAVSEAMHALIKKKRRPGGYSGKDCRIEFVSGHTRLDKWASCFVSCRKWKIESIVTLVGKGVTEKWVKGIALKKEGGRFWVFFTQGIGGNYFPQHSVAVEFMAKSGANTTFTPDNRNEYQQGYIKGEVEIQRVLNGQDADKVIKLSKEGKKDEQKSGQKDE